jgi:hypothetical protein
MARTYRAAYFSNKLKPYIAVRTVCMRGRHRRQAFAAHHFLRKFRRARQTASLLKRQTFYTIFPRGHPHETHQVAEIESTGSS